jgi:Tol biopolymer transport system component
MGTVLVLVALLVAVGALAVGIYKFAGRISTASRAVAPLQTMQLKKLTTGVVVSNVNISPDGKYVVYSVQLADAQEGLWIKQTATGTTLQIVPSAKAHFGGTSFSPDSNFVYYVLLTEDDPHRSLYQVPVIGGTSKKLLNSISGPVTFSPDGKRFAFVRRDARQGEDDLMTANADGSGIETLATRKGLDWFKLGPSWSPDGKRIACGAGTNAGGLAESVYEVEVDTGAVKQMTPQKWAGVGRVCWLGDGSGLLVLAVQQGQRLSQIWDVSYPSGDAHRITNDLHDHGESSLGVTADSSVLAALDSGTVSNIWITPANGDTIHAKQITVRSEAGDGVYCLAWTSDGKLVYSSAASGTSDIWLMNADGTNQRQLTNDGYVNYGADVSPDDRYVVFASTRADFTPHIWRMDIDGSNLRQLTNTEDRRPSFTLDGQWVIYQSYRTGKATLWKVPVDSGEPVQLTDYASLGPEISPDGKLILCDYFDEQVTPTRWRMAVISSAGGPPIKLFDHVEHPIQKEFDWSGDGRALLFLGMPVLPGNIWSQPLNGGKAVPLTNFNADYIYNFARSRDGRQIAYSRGVNISDVIMITDFR